MVVASFAKSDLFVVDIIKQHLNPIFRLRPLYKPNFPPPGPFKQVVGEVFKCIWGVLHIEFACENS